MSIDTLGLVDPYKLAKKAQTLQGKVGIEAMHRVSNSINSNSGEMMYSMHFATDADNICFIEGELQGEVTLSCQRCLQTFTRSIKCEFVVSPVADDSAAKALPPEYEPVITNNGKLDALELLEDELILALPIVAKHEDGEAGCNEVIEDQAQDLNRPFQVLQTLKLNKNAPTAEDK